MNSIDLFEQVELLPANAQAIIDKYSVLELDYISVAEFQKELQSVGYTFDYYLDAIPYNLRTFKTNEI